MISASHKMDAEKAAKERKGECRLITSPSHTRTRTQTETHSPS